MDILSLNKSVAYLLATGLLSLAAAFPAAAGVFLSKQEALEAAFPGGASVQANDLFLTPEQKTAVEKDSGVKLESQLVTVYEGRRAGALAGIAMFDTQVVRTMPETLLVVVAPEGSVTSTWMCAFHEPLEYMPNKKWFQQFPGKGSASELRVGRDIAGVAGSTLSARAVTAAVRRALAIHKIWAASGSGRR